jgi:hypothetical protein
MLRSSKFAIMGQSFLSLFGGMMNRRNLAIFLLLGSVSALLSQFLALLLPGLPPLLYILLASLSFIGLILIFDRYLWRWLRIDNQPNIHGDWQGTLSTSYTEQSEVEPIRVRIVQRWLSIRIDFIATYASSSSSTSTFFRDGEGQHVLAYIYRSEPFEGYEEKVPFHIGLSVLRLVETGRLSGYYHYMEATSAGIEFTHGQVVFTRA